MVSWSSTSEAIWFLDSFDLWAIGSLEDIGADIFGMVANGTQCPFDLRSENWVYASENGLKKANGNEINIVCVEGIGLGKV